MQGQLIVLSGPSGIGKGTITCKLLKRNPNMRASVSYTTRAIRPMDVPGVSYHFVGVETFDKMAKQGAFLEHAGIYDHQYGTPRAFVEESLQKGIDVILEIEPDGAFQIKRALEDALLIYLLPPDMRELRTRLYGRGTETEQKALQRFQNAKIEIAHSAKYDFCVVNDDVDVCVSEVESIVRACRLKAKYASGHISKLMEEQI